MSFHPRTTAALRLLAVLLLAAFAAATAGCLHHADAAPHGHASAFAGARSAAPHPHSHTPSHHPSTVGFRGFPDSGESCVPNYPSLPVQEISAPRAAAFSVLLSVLLGIRSPHLPVRGRDRPSAFPARAREGRTTRTSICCWRI